MNRARTRFVLRSIATTQLWNSTSLEFNDTEKQVVATATTNISNQLGSLNEMLSMELAFSKRYTNNSYTQSIDRSTKYPHMAHVVCFNICLNGCVRVTSISP